MEGKAFRHETAPLVAALLASVVIVIPRFSPGIPQGVDSASHLSKILFMVKSYDSVGYIPSWYPDWYGGTPFLLLYSPLSYLLTFAVALTGIGAVTAYKLVDAIFFVIAPVTVYFLGRELDLDGEEAAWGALLFALTPTVVGSYLFYDRFPNVVALPVACLFLTSLAKMVKGRMVIQTLVASIILFSVLILIHHLSAFLSLIIAVLALFSFAGSSARFKTLARFSAVIVGAVAISSPWLLNFIQASSQILENPFYNKNVEFAFIRLTYSLYNYLTIEQGIIHFILATAAIGIWLSRSHGKNTWLAPMILLFLGMEVFEVGWPVTKWIESIGQTLVVLALVLMLGLVLHVSKKARRNEPSYLFLVLWFTVFFWLSLGYYAMPLANVPIFQVVWRSLDIHRFWLYLAVPIALLAGKVAGTFSRSSVRRSSSVGLATIVILILAGATIKAEYSLTQDVNPHLPYTTLNSEIPQELLDYFKSENEYGRILPVRCPMWIYVLPSYAGKPLVDGWYPQEKLLPVLLNISDYRINDLETSGGNRTRIWEGLIRKNQELGIRWVLIGNSNSTLIKNLSNSTFKQDAFIRCGTSNLTVLKNTVENSWVRLNSIPNTDVRYYRPAPDRILVDIDHSMKDVELVVREAYHPSWSARIDGETVPIQATNEGFMSIRIKTSPCSVVILHSNPANPYLYLSLATIGLLILVWFYSKTIARRMHGARF